MRRLFFIITLPLISVIGLNAQKLLTLDDCTKMALGEDTQLQKDIELQTAATYTRKAAFANFFPKLSANGAYMWNEKNVVLLPNSLQTSLGTFNASQQSFTPSNPDFFHKLFPELSKDVEDAIGKIYDDFRDKLTFDVHNVFVGQVGLTQPIYVGGKLLYSYRLSQSAEKISQLKASGNKENLVVKVNDTYWLVVSLQEKVKLAEQYRNLIDTLLQHVEAAVEEGIATKSDILKVKVKLNESEMAKDAIENSLIIAKMTLCQLCGLPLNSKITLDSSNLDKYAVSESSLDIDSSMVKNRSEIKILTEAEKMARTTAKLSSAGLKPNIVAAANYVASSPNVLDGFNANFMGGFNVGVVVNIPIAHVDAIYAYKAAKHAANVAKLDLDNATKTLTVQATQTAQLVEESNRNLKQAQLNMENAEENLRLAEESFKEGMATVTDVMIAQTGWQTAFNRKIDAAITLRSNEVLLQKQLGKLKVE